VPKSRSTALLLHSPGCRPAYPRLIPRHTYFWYNKNLSKRLLGPTSTRPPPVGAPAPVALVARLRDRPKVREAELYQPVLLNGIIPQWRGVPVYQRRIRQTLRDVRAGSEHEPHRLCWDKSVSGLAGGVLPSKQNALTTAPEGLFSQRYPGIKWALPVLLFSGLLHEDGVSQPHGASPLRKRSPQGAGARAPSRLAIPNYLIRMVW